MNNDNKERVRFQKPYHYLVARNRNVFRNLRALFNNFQLETCKDELNHWQRLALANDQSAYDEAYLREDLMDFIHALLKLVEAFWLIRQRHIYKDKPKLCAGMDKQVQYLDDNEIAKPKKVISQFCTTFKHSYAEIELLDLLDAVITYDGCKKLYKGNLVLFYQWMKWLIYLAYKVDKTTLKTSKNT
ncbi:MAG TPA: hypothetical protein VHB70_19375 [Parafilimonas sp.]|nr:hypothetical protein [Parafilimonas sp.]